MKKTIQSAFFVLIVLLISKNLTSQSRRGKAKSNHYFSASISFNPDSTVRTHFNEGEESVDNLFLTFLTSYSGTFILEEVEYDFSFTDDYDLNNQTISLGFNYMLIKPSGIYHEIGLTRLSHSESHFNRTVTIRTLPQGTINTTREKFDQSLLEFGFKYEIGKFLNHSDNNNKFNLALGFRVETTSRHLRRKATLPTFGYFGWIHNIDLSITPSLSLRLSQLLSLDVKLIPYLRLLDYSTIQIDPLNNIQASPIKIRRTLPLNAIDFNLAGALHLRFLIKDGSSRRKRRRK